VAASDDEQPQRLDDAALCPPWLRGSYAHILRRHQQGNLPHALLFSGLPELGKQWFATNLVRVLLCRNSVNDELMSACGTCTSCAQLSAGSSTEFRYLQPAGKSRTIKIDPVRELVEWLQLSANAERYRIALITGADTMNHAAANAFLKTLEEPAARTLCILVADRPAQLPATLISRCQQVPLTVEDEPAAIQWLSENLGNKLGAGGDAAQALVQSGGAPLRAIREADPSWQAQQATIDAAWWNLFMHKRSVGAIVESLKDVPLTVCLSRFLTLCAVAMRHRQGAGQFSPIKSLSGEQTEAVERLNSVQWFTIHDDLHRLHRIESASFKTQTVLEGFLADTRLKIKG